MNIVSTFGSALYLYIVSIAMFTHPSTVLPSYFNSTLCFCGWVGCSFWQLAVTIITATATTPTPTVAPTVTSDVVITLKQTVSIAANRAKRLFQPFLCFFSCFSSMMLRYLIYDCKSTQILQHGKIFFRSPKKKCIFAAGNIVAIGAIVAIVTIGTIVTIKKK